MAIRIRACTLACGCRPFCLQEPWCLLERVKTMSDLSIFLAGVCVTIPWSAGIGLLLWAAYQGGKSEEKRKQALENRPTDWVLYSPHHSAPAINYWLRHYFLGAFWRGLLRLYPGPGQRSLQVAMTTFEQEEIARTSVGDKKFSCLSRYPRLSPAIHHPGQWWLLFAPLRIMNK